MATSDKKLHLTIFSLIGFSANTQIYIFKYHHKTANPVR